MNTDFIIIRQFEQQDYPTCWQAMQTFTNLRQEDSVDEIWLLEHPPIFTLGHNSKDEHILQKSEIPIIQSDRGGQVTYHGPGQLMMYTLVDIKRRKLTIRDYVSKLEHSVVNLLAAYGIAATTRCDAPGVYVNDKKICSIGLRVRKGCTYHGIALNVNTDLQPFNFINPCGFQGLEMTTLALEGGPSDLRITGQQLVNYFCQNLGYTHLQWL